MKKWRTKKSYEENQFQYTLDGFKETSFSFSILTFILSQKRHYPKNLIFSLITENKG
jgi:hypothetical protein